MPGDAGKLWDFYLSTGFLYPEKVRALGDTSGLARDHLRTLLEVPGAYRVALTLDAKGEVVSACTAAQFSDVQSWVMHLASNRNRLALLGAIGDAGEATIAFAPRVSYTFTSTNVGVGSDSAVAARYDMAAYASAFGAHLGLTGSQIGALYRGGFLHDVGKIGIPDDVLLKPGPLTPEERAIMQRHTIIGEALCGNLRLLRPIRPIVRHHHERCDGSGYPDGLAGDAIPLLAQLIAIVDVYDALTSNRIYRAATTSDAALSELRAEAKRGWHRADLVDAFGELVARGGMAASPG